MGYHIDYVKINEKIGFFEKTIQNWLKQLKSVKKRIIDKINKKIKKVEIEVKNIFSGTRYTHACDYYFSYLNHKLSWFLFLNWSLI